MMALCREFPPTTGGKSGVGKGLLALGGTTMRCTQSTSKFGSEAGATNG